MTDRDAAQSSTEQGRPWLAWTSLLAAAFLAFANGIHGPLVFDDVATIVENESIRHLDTAFSPPADRGLPVTGRPVANASFALNYWVGGIDPRGYHVVNIGLHAASALLLFGLIRRTLRRPTLEGRFAPHETSVAWAAALIWLVHPLTTAAVSYISQRTELLMTCCYLVTLYGAVRALDGKRPQAWLALSLVACWCGMATKEVMVSAPLITLLYDRTFGAGTFREAWRRRRWFYASLAASWLLLASLMFNTGARAGTAGFGLGITPFAYAMKQCEALVHYLRLTVWPAPLVFDYGGARLIDHPLRIAPQAMLVVALLIAAGWALVRRPALGFGGAMFFAVLAPTSSFVPVADTMFEHRMYLPLAIVCAVASCALYLMLLRRACWAPLIILPLIAMTVRRNQDYRSEIALWFDTAVKQPDNVRAHYTLGTALSAAGKLDAAVAEYRRALQFDPRSAPAHNDLANVLARRGDMAGAIEHYEAALRLAPSAQAHNNLANVLLRARQSDAAREHYDAALQLRPDFADAHNNLGNLLAQRGAFMEAASHYEMALRLRPDLVDAHANLANVLAQTGHPEDAILHYEAALRQRPDFADAHFNLATTLAQLHRWAGAVGHYETTLRLKPDYPHGEEALARARMAQEMFGR